MNAITLPIDRVVPNPDQPRKVFDQAKLEELAESIRQHGLLQPIRVKADGDRFLIVCGERRWRAHKLLGSATIEAILSDDMTADDVADQAIIENMARADITPLEEARAFQARLDAGYTVEELARRLGLKQSWRITERTALLNLRPEFQDALARGILNPSQGYEMSRLSAIGQRQLFDAIGSGQCKTYAELRRVAGAISDTEKQCSMFADKGPSKEEVDQAHALERKIAQVENILSAGFRDNEVVILRKVNPLNADVMADRLEVIEKALKNLRLALRASKAAAARRAAAA